MSCRKLLVAMLVFAAVWCAAPPPVQAADPATRPTRGPATRPIPRRTAPGRAAAATQPEKIIPFKPATPAEHAAAIAPARVAAKVLADQDGMKTREVETDHFLIRAEQRRVGEGGRAR